MPSKRTAKTKSAHKPVIVIGIFTLVSLVFFFSTLLAKNEPKLKINDQTFVYDIADSKDERVKGLSGRPNLPSNEVLVFDFPETGSLGIWMKDMNFAIDIIWLDTNKTVVDFESNVSPDTYPNSFYSDTPAKYVVETNAGLAQSLNLQVGDVFEF